MGGPVANPVCAEGLELTWGPQVLGWGGGGWAGGVREAKVRSEAGPGAKRGQIWED